MNLEKELDNLNCIELRILSLTHSIVLNDYLIKFILQNKYLIIIYYTKWMFIYKWIFNKYLYYETNSIIIYYINNYLTNITNISAIK